MKTRRSGGAESYERVRYATTDQGDPKTPSRSRFFYVHESCIAGEIKPFDDKSDLFPSPVVEPQMLPETAEIPSPDKDSEMHYHLGIAYKEMELFDYAIAEFEKAASNPSIQFDCYIMLGSCFYEKGDYDQAIQRFKEATQIRGVDPGETCPTPF